MSERRRGLRSVVRRLINRAGYDLIGASSHEAYLCDDIPGWFTANEARLLYATVILARPRTVLEIGTFLGRSTATIALGIRAGQFPCSFTSVDFDIADEAAFFRLMPTTHGRPSIMPAEYRLAFAAGMSTSAYAQQGLRRHALDRFVTLASGDFHQLGGGPYGMVFADCLHDVDEIERNLPGIMGLLEPGGILAIHDVTDAHRARIGALAGDLRFIVCEDSLGLYRRG